MQIQSIISIPIVVPIKQPIKMAGILYAKSQNLITRIEIEDGTVGWGEAPSAPAMTGETIESMMAAVSYLTPHLIGKDASSFINNMELMDSLLYGNSSAKAAIEIALFDLVGKVLHKSMSELMGVKKRDQANVLWMLATGIEKADTEEAQIKLDEGFTSFKIKVGGESINNDINRVNAIRNLVGDNIQLSADANQAWSYEEGKAFAKSAGSVLDFIEQPVMGHDLDAMAKIANSSDAPIGADEGLHSLADIVAHSEKGAANGGSLKMIKLGGALKVLNAAELAHSLGMKVNLAGKLCETSISAAAVSHLAVAVPQIDWGLSIKNQYAAADVVKNPLKIFEGKVFAPDGYGLGIEVDEDTLYSNKNELKQSY